MIAQIVPIKKIRSNLELLSYLVPESLQANIRVGQRVIVPFRSSQIVGLVWQIDQFTSADQVSRKLKSITQLIDQTEFIDLNLRRLIDWVAEYYITPRPTVLASAIPELFYRLNRRARPVKILSQNQNQAQQLILAPYLNYPRMDQLRSRSDFIEYSQSLSHQEQIQIWQKVASGEQVVVFGTYQPVYLPFKNLRQITIFEPENDLFKYEQNPKVHISVVAKKLAEIHGSKLVIKSYASVSSSSSSIQVANISSEKRLINFQTDSWLESRLAKNRRVIIFYNVYDIKEGESRFGIKSLKADLAKRFPDLKIAIIDRDIDLRQNLDAFQIIIGTAKMLYLSKIIKGDLLVPVIDPLLDRPDFQPNKILAQINKLGRFSQSILIQTKKPDHPFIAAIRLGSITEYLADVKQKKQKLGQFPYGFWIRLTYSDQSAEICIHETEKLVQDLTSHLGGVIDVFGPTLSISQSKTKKHRYSILVKVRDDHTGSSLRDIRAVFLKLKKPWSIDPHPVNLV